MGLFKIGLYHFQGALRQLHFVKYSELLTEPVKRRTYTQILISLVICLHFKSHFCCLPYLFLLFIESVQKVKKLDNCEVPCGTKFLRVLFFAFFRFFL